MYLQDLKREVLYVVVLEQLLQAVHLGWRVQSVHQTFSFAGLEVFGLQVVDGPDEMVPPH